MLDWPEKCNLIFLKISYSPPLSMLQPALGISLSPMEVAHYVKSRGNPFCDNSRSHLFDRLRCKTARIMCEIWHQVPEDLAISSKWELVGDFFICSLWSWGRPRPFASSCPHLTLRAVHYKPQKRAHVKMIYQKRTIFNALCWTDQKSAI